MNTVGYETVTANKGKYVAFAVQFETVDQQEIAIKDLFSSSVAFAGTVSAGKGGDEIWLWDSTAGDWTKYYYQGGRGSKNTGWSKAGSTDLIDETETVSAGTTVFFYRGGNTTTLTAAGGVKLFTTTVSTACNKGKYTFLAYPWPIAMPVSDFTKYYVGGDPAGTVSAGKGGDEIWKWDSVAGDWVKYYYQSGRGSKNTGWSKAGSTDLTEEAIDPGVGFFFYRGGNNVTITFTNATK